MRHFIFILLFLGLLNNVNSQSEIHVNNPPLGIGQIEKIFFISEHIGYSIGNFGKLAKTTNGGINWELIKTDSIGVKFDYFASLYFINEDIGYLIAKNGEFFKTINGGKTINSLFNFNVTPYENPFIHFYSENIGVVKFVNGDRDIYTTIDGGLTFEQKIDSPTGEGFDIVNDSIYYSNNEDSICRSIDQGESWTNISKVPYNIWSIQFINDSVGFVYGYAWDGSPKNYYISKTIDGGFTWETSLVHGDELKQLNKVYFVDEWNGFVYGNNPYIYETKDGGKTWREVQYYFSSNVTKDVYDIYFVNSKIGYMASDFGMFLVTKDGGVIWDLYYKSVTLSNLNSVAEIDEGRQLIIGHDGFCLIKDSSDYSIISIPSSEDLTSAGFSNDTTGVIIGNQGNVFLSENSGESWRIIESNSNQLNDVSFRGSKGLICGKQGTIIFSEDYGRTWKDVSYINTNLNVPYHFVSGEIIKDDTLLVLGNAARYNGFDFDCFIILLSSYNKGITWHEKVINNDIHFYDVPYGMINLTSGDLIINTEEYIYKSEDKGNSWNILTNDNDITLPLLGSEVGQVIGINARGKNIVFSSADTCETWDTVFNFLPVTQYYSNINDFLITQTDTIFIGDKGLILSNTLMDNHSNHYVIDKKYTDCTPVFSNITEKACGSYLSPSRKYRWTTSGTYIDTLINNIGCDSIITINLTVLNNSSSSINPIACNDYISPSRKYTWTTSGTYIDTLINNNGCDSVIYINLSVIDLDTSVIYSEDMLIAGATDVNYQWLDCKNNYFPIEGATSKTFKIKQDGEYAVEIIQDHCRDTSFCHTVLGIVSLENYFLNLVNLYPNPSSDYINIELGQKYKRLHLRILNAMGNLIASYEYEMADRITVDLNENKGMYYIEIQFDNEETRLFKVIKN